MNQKSIYLDHNASTPLLPEVINAMMPYLKNHYGNPSSNHAYGQEAKGAITQAREQVATLLNCSPDEIIFTSGGSESNNLAIKGIAELHPHGHIITSAIEHPAVLEVCRYLLTKGYEVTFLPVDEYGLVSPDAVQAAIRPDTFLITIMLANNEVGTIQPLQEITRIAQRQKILVHSDAAQAVGKIAVNLRNLGIDLLSIAGHKMNAPKGIGALFIKTGIKIAPQLQGAGHESGLRPGTENVLEIVGLGAAAQLFHENETAIVSELKSRGDQFWQELYEAIPEIRLNGHPEERLPNTINVYFPGIDSNTLLAGLPQIAASAGAACHANSTEPSHVLKAMNLSDERILGSIRFSVGRTTTPEEVSAAVQKIAEAYQHLTQTQPVVTTASNLNDIRLTHYTHGLGCACKIRPQNLERILKKIQVVHSDQIQVGFETADDAAVYRLNNETSLVATVDFFTPIVDDPFDFGRIAAANSLSDIYAMGGKPIFALNIVAFPEKRLPTQVLEQILVGAQNTAQEAGIPIIGGHTIEDNEPKFGWAVTGIVHPDKVWRNIGAQAGDALILTKPIGLGILTTALKRGLLDEPTRITITDIMSELNSRAADIFQKFPIHACTDVTGFGLLGHLYEMLFDGNISARVITSQVPIIPRTIEMVRRDVIPGGTDANLNYLRDRVDWNNQVAPMYQTILCDAQTSGGLLAAVPEIVAEKLVQELHNSEIHQAAIIGRFENAADFKIFVVP
jgi:cysteine desulfurase